ncbi:hypothetical protein J6590_051400 [Homalodisca vitripennis]|nr:hypothetical protein J6590_051400 [Homalodisca vitripennis]
MTQQIFSNIYLGLKLNPCSGPGDKLLTRQQIGLSMSIAHWLLCKGARNFRMVCRRVAIRINSGYRISGWDYSYRFREEDGIQEKHEIVETHLGRGAFLSLRFNWKSSTLHWTLLPTFTHDRFNHHDGRSDTLVVCTPAVHSIAGPACDDFPESHGPPETRQHVRVAGLHFNVVHKADTIRSAIARGFLPAPCPAGYPRDVSLDCCPPF